MFLDEFFFRIWMKVYLTVCVLRPGEVHGSRLRDTSCGHELTIRPLESVLLGCIGLELSLLGNPEGSVTHVVDGVLKVSYCNTPPVCWVMGVIDSGLTGSSTVSLRVRPVLGKEGGLLCPEGVFIAGRLSGISLGRERCPALERRPDHFKTLRMGCIVFGCFLVCCVICLVYITPFFRGE